MVIYFWIEDNYVDLYDAAFLHGTRSLVWKLELLM